MQNDGSTWHSRMPCDFFMRVYSTMSRLLLRFNVLYLIYISIWVIISCKTGGGLPFLQRQPLTGDAMKMNSPQRTACFPKPCLFWSGQLKEFNRRWSKQLTADYNEKCISSSNIIYMHIIGFKDAPLIKGMGGMSKIKVPGGPTRAYYQTIYKWTAHYSQSC